MSLYRRAVHANSPLHAEPAQTEYNRRRLLHKVRTSFCPQDAARQFRQRMVFGLVFLCCLGMARVVSAQELIWTSHGPEGGMVFALAIDPSAPTTVYAGSGPGGGVFKSTNGGASWSAVNTGLTNTSVLALAIDPLTPSTVYAGTNGGGVFVSSQITPAPQITVTRTLSRDAQNNVIVNVTLTNTGGTTAQATLVTVANIGSTAASVMPTDPVNISAGGSAPVTLLFPPSVGPSGTNTTLTVGGTYVGGSFNFASRITLP
jgi:hypothetical protein